MNLISFYGRAGFVSLSAETQVVWGGGGEKCQLIGEEYGIV